MNEVFAGPRPGSRKKKLALGGPSPPSGCTTRKHARGILEKLLDEETVFPAEGQLTNRLTAKVAQKPLTRTEIGWRARWLL